MPRLTSGDYSPVHTMPVCLHFPSKASFLYEKCFYCNYKVIIIHMYKLVYFDLKSLQSRNKSLQVPALMLCHVEHLHQLSLKNGLLSWTKCPQVGIPNSASSNPKDGYKNHSLKSCWIAEYILLVKSLYIPHLRKCRPLRKFRTIYINASLVLKQGWCA